MVDILRAETKVFLTRVILHRPNEGLFKHHISAEKSSFHLSLAEISEFFRISWYGDEIIRRIKFLGFSDKNIAELNLIQAQTKRPDHAI